MIIVSDYKLGGHFPAYMVTMDGGRDRVQAIFFGYDYAMLYARALRDASSRLGLDEPIEDKTTNGRVG